MRTKTGAWNSVPWSLIVPSAAFFGVAAGMAYHRHRVARGRREFHREQLVCLFAAGCTTDRSVRLWGRAPHPGNHEVDLTVTVPAKPESSASEATAAHLVGRFRFDIEAQRDADATFAFDFPSDVPGARPLRPNTTYCAELSTLGGDRIGCAEFVTSPGSAAETPERFAIAAMSCHNPFNDDGSRDERADRLLSIVPDVLERYAVKRVLMMGDQVYGDLPESCSLLNDDYFRIVAPEGRAHLLDCTREEVRALYQQRHRTFWSSAGAQEIQRRYACHMILDDHEVFDNFGSAPEHMSERYANLLAGAMDAFFDYQGRRTFGHGDGPSNTAGRSDEGSRPERPSSFHHHLDFGTISIFVMDLRSQRRATDETLELFADEQLQDLKQFLSERRQAHVVGVVLSVPIAHVPDWAATLGSPFRSPDGDAADRWSDPRAHACRGRLLQVLRAHQAACPHQRLILLGGDVHVGAVAALRWGEGIRDSYELIASALSNSTGVVAKELVDLAQAHPRVRVNDDGAQVDIELMDATSSAEGASFNPYGGLNIGIVQVERRSERESSVRLLLIGCTEHGKPEPRVVFDSGAL